MGKPNLPQPFPAPIRKATNKRPAPPTRTPQAPPAFRPQSVPKCLQPKAAPGGPQPSGQAKHPPAPPRVAPAPPPAYRPQPPPKVLQRKVVETRQSQGAQPGHKAVVPPTTLPPLSSSRQPGNESRRSPVVPLAGRPNSAPKALQKKSVDNRPRAGAATTCVQRSTPDPAFSLKQAPKVFYKSGASRVLQCTRYDVRVLPDSFGDAKKKVAPELGDGGYKYEDFPEKFVFHNTKSGLQEVHTIHISVPGQFTYGREVKLAEFEDFHITLAPASGRKNNLHFHFDAKTGKFLEKSYSGHKSNNLNDVTQEDRAMVEAIALSFVQKFDLRVDSYVPS